MDVPVNYNNNISQPRGKIKKLEYFLQCRTRMDVEIGYDGVSSSNN